MKQKDIDRLENNVEEIFKRIGKLENQDTEIITTIKQIALTVNEFKESFTNHDKNEMEKYNEINTSIQEVNKKLSDINNLSINTEKTVAHLEKIVDKKEENLSEVIGGVSKDLSMYKKENNEKISKILSNINKAIGAILVIGIAFTVSYKVWEYMDNKNQKLETELQKLRDNQNKNYGRLQEISNKK